LPRISHLPYDTISSSLLLHDPHLHPYPLTSVMYPAVPNKPGTRMTYANEIHAVRLVQRKYLWRLVTMSALCQPSALQTMSRLLSRDSGTHADAASIAPS
jgi:hypothetical protein